MNFPDNLLRTLSWSFIHSLWQGVMLTIFAGLIMLVTKKSKASLRYGFLCTLFFLFLGGVALTFLIEWNTGTGKFSGLVPTPESAGAGLIFHHSLLSQIIENFALFLNTHSQWIVLTWLIILGLKSVRVTLDMIYVYRLRNHEIFMPAGEWRIRFQSLGESIGLRKKVSLLESAQVQVPMVMGHFKPVVLVPLGILMHLPPAEVEAVLLHELAHIRRHDYLINFIQRIAELLFFFNPGLIWVSQLLRVERENCCDDIAISNTKDKLQFVEALISFKEHAMKHPRYALGLFGKRNLLLQRMKRIVYNRNKVLSPVEFVFFSMNIIVFIILISAISKPQSAVTRSFSYPVQPLQSISSAPVRQITPIPGRRHVYNEKPDRLSSRNSSFAIGDIKNKTPVLPIKNLSPDKKQMERISTDNIIGQPERNYDQAQMEFKQLQLLRWQAEKDRQQAEKDREQAEKDRVQAEKDRGYAALDRIRADQDRLQAEQDREQAEKDRIQADKDRAQAELDKKTADKDRQRAAEMHSMP